MASTQITVSEDSKTAQFSKGRGSVVDFCVRNISAFAHGEQEHRRENFRAEEVKRVESLSFTQMPRNEISSPVEHLLEGVRLLANFLLDAEADYLCGVRFGACSKGRVNFRAGSHKRSLRTRYGKVSLKVPHLRHLHVRPSMSKRFRRLEDMMVDTLSDVYLHGATAERVGFLVKALWTVELGNSLLEELSQAISVLLEYWRVSGANNMRLVSGAREDGRASALGKRSTQQETYCDVNFPAGGTPAGFGGIACEKMGVAS